MNSRHLQSISQLNAAVVSGSFGDIVAQGEKLHSERIARISELVATRVPSVRLVLVSGPSAAGKTTTAIRLCRKLEACGMSAIRISTDDYFVGDARNPRDADGKLDYEHLDAVDRDRFEDTRLMRRIVRDRTFRDMSPENTIRLWEKVSAGEMRWINPYRGYADSIFNTSLDYEIAVMKPVVEPVLRSVPYLGGRENSEVRRLLAVLEAVEPVRDISVIPKDSILRESVGGSIFDYS